MRKWVVCISLLAVIAAVSACAFTNLRVSLDRSRQKVTMADMRSIAVMLEAMATDRKSLALVPSSPHELRRVPFEKLERALVPQYAGKVPRTDGWGHPFGVYVNEQHYLIRSVARDGHAEGSRYSFGINLTFDADLVFSDGNFLRYPEGT